MSRKLTTRHGSLKWFSRDRHYGFVELEDPKEDALLHEACLEGVDQSLLVKGALIDCECTSTDKGTSVQKINSIAAGKPCATPDGEWVPVRVKWYNELKGYGFLTRGEETTDIFVHATVAKTAFSKKLQPMQALLAIIDEGAGGGPKALAVKEPDAR